MKPISYKRHRFPPDTIRLAVWLYYRFTTSLRDVEEMLAQRGIDTSYEAIRCWANKFGPAIAANIRRRRGRPDSVWHLDEMVVRIKGKRMFMWRAVDKEGEVLDVLVQKRRNKAAAMKLLRKLLKNQGYVPDEIVTDGLASYPAALKTWAAAIAISPVDYATTTGSKTPTFPSDDESERCSASSPRARPSGSSPPTQRSTTPSIFNATSSPAKPSEPSEQPPWRSGSLRPPLRREIPNFGPCSPSGR
jgi:transposase-like protein